VESPALQETIPPTKRRVNVYAPAERRRVSLGLGHDRSHARWVARWDDHAARSATDIVRSRAGAANPWHVVTSTTSTTSHVRTRNSEDCRAEPATSTFSHTLVDWLVNFHDKFGFLRHFVFELTARTEHTDGRTDRRTGKTRIAAY